LDIHHHNFILKFKVTFFVAHCPSHNVSKSSFFQEPVGESSEHTFLGFFIRIFVKTQNASECSVTGDKFYFAEQKFGRSVVQILHIFRGVLFLFFKKLLAKFHDFFFVGSVHETPNY
jgi:hypothetical protein